MILTKLDTKENSLYLEDCIKKNMSLSAINYKVIDPVFHPSSSTPCDYSVLHWGSEIQRAKDKKQPLEIIAFGIYSKKISDVQ